MSRIALFCMTALLVAGYGVGPRLLAPQSDRALNRCAERVTTETISVSWRVVPTAGWVCTDGNGKKSYLAWWA
jgi:hypothetical protein